MNVDQNEQETLRTKQIEAALSTYPVAPLPPAFTARLMTQVEATPQTVPPAAHSPSLRYYLRLYSFELACATMLTLVVVVGIGWPLLAQVGMVPSPWTADTMHNTLLTALHAEQASVWYTFGFCGLILLELIVALLAWVTWVEQPRVKIG